VQRRGRPIQDKFIPPTNSNDRIQGASGLGRGGIGKELRGNPGAIPPEQLQERFDHAIAQKTLVVRALELRHRHFFEKDPTTLPFYLTDILHDLDRIIDDGMSVLEKHVQDHIRETRTRLKPIVDEPGTQLNQDIGYKRGDKLLRSPEEMAELQKLLDSANDDLATYDAIENAKTLDPTRASAAADLLVAVATGNEEQAASALAGVGGHAAVLTAEKLLKLVKRARKGAPAFNRLPGGEKSRGIWTQPDKPGNSGFVPVDPKRWGLKVGEAVPFKNGYPDFSKWAERTFDVPNLAGSRNDFPEIHRRMHELYPKEFKNPTAAKQWLRVKGLTPHHVPGAKEIQIIPRELNKLPHKDGAYDLRLIGEAE